MDKAMKMRFLSKDHWLRLLFMVIFACVNYVVQVLIWIIAAVQFVLSLLTGMPNKNLLHFGEGLSVYAYHMLRFLTYNTEDKPYPFSAWPGVSKTEKK